MFTVDFSATDEGPDALSAVADGLIKLNVLASSKNLLWLVTGTDPLSLAYAVNIVWSIWNQEESLLSGVFPCRGSVCLHAACCYRCEHN